MNLEEARGLFGLAGNLSHDELKENIEQKLFENKNDVLQKYMVPTLLLKKLRVLTPLSIAETVLLGKREEPAIFSHDLGGPYFSQSLFLEAYEKNVSGLKLQLMNVSGFKNLCDVILEMTDLHEVYMELFREQFNEYSEALPEEVNTRDIIDTGTLLQGLKAGELHAHMIWNIERELARISKIQKLT